MEKGERGKEQREEREERERAKARRDLPILSRQIFPFASILK
jgi:hypothetical protein